MKKDLSIQEALPVLLEAALDDQPLERLQAVVRTTPSLATGPIMRSLDWKRAAKGLSLSQLAALIRLLTLAEVAIPGWLSGSVSPVISLFWVYAQRAGPVEDTLADWVLRHSSNGYLPYGRHNLGARSLAELRDLRALAEKKRAARASAESGRKEEARGKRSVRATRNIFGAIRRGDAPAVQALLDQGADLSGRNADGVTPLEYAIRIGAETMVELLTTDRNSDRPAEQMKPERTVLAAAKGSVAMEMLKFRLTELDEGDVRQSRENDNLRLVCLVEGGGKLAIWGRHDSRQNIDRVLKAGMPCDVECGCIDPESWALGYGHTKWVPEGSTLRVLSASSN